jgi:hypothetical protein
LETKAIPKRVNVSDFFIRKRQKVRLQVGFRSEMLSRLIIYQTQPRNEKNLNCKVDFPLVQFSVARFLGDLAHFKGLELPKGRFSIAKKQFFINTNDLKGFELAIDGWISEGGVQPDSCMWALCATVEGRIIG